jgi:hypothetical protein
MWGFVVHFNRENQIYIMRGMAFCLRGFSIFYALFCYENGRYSVCFYKLAGYFVPKVTISPNIASAISKK